MNDNVEMTFADILASTIHDTKNSLGLLYNTIEEIIIHCQGEECQDHRDFFPLQYELKRLNSGLIRLLTLYKSQKGQLCINIDYHSVSDFLEDTIIQNAPLLESKGIEINLDCPENLCWVFDSGLVTGVIDNVLNNAYRYSKDKISVTAAQEGGYLAILIEDDGRGYPENMLINDDPTAGCGRGVNFDTGSTGLGLYFATLVAGYHIHNGQKGFIKMTNGGRYGGGVFSLYLP